MLSIKLLFIQTFVFLVISHSVSSEDHSGGQSIGYQEDGLSQNITYFGKGKQEGTTALPKRDYSNIENRRHWGRGRGFHGKYGRNGHFGGHRFARCCKFPWKGPNNHYVYPITPYQLNDGWAMSPDQQCKFGSWCPYACQPGYYSAQWDPQSANPTGKGSMNGGLYCDENGILKKPFPDRPYCMRGMGNVIINNTLPKPVSACQTVYPGNEAMIIPSTAPGRGFVRLNVVPKTYWLRTSAQFYVNLDGTNDENCVWGKPDVPMGNWGPYIFGAGQAADGNTYVSVRYNPLYVEAKHDPKRAYNVRVRCVSGKCVFPPPNECKCEKGICSLRDGCTVTLTDNARAQFVLYQ
ncbi:hypothetical protein BB560_000457 [Smittium megazygosporum]|uniref:Uncharacterized protein n=1 Tax=Smittium megazygosporum TaxID=133381 RepID=A0A2T9ZKB6_9FUNG|nr:hypothetical protein BB560_000457 [Smittium megazygosporum]